MPNLFAIPHRLLFSVLILVISSFTASASVVRVDTTEVGNKLDLTEIEVTSGAGSGFPNRVFSFGDLIPATVSNFLSIPENNSINTITVLGTPDAVAPTGNDRLALLKDAHLNTGIFNPSASSPGVQVTFDQPLVNGPGEEFVIFELTIGTGQTPDPLIVRQLGGVGTPREVPSSHYQLSGVIPEAAWPNTFVSTVENGGTTDFAELSVTSLANNGTVTNAKWHVVPIDLTTLGIPAWETLSSVEIVSRDGTRAADLLMVMGLLPVTSPGDYDSDRDVDGRDFLEWQRQFGATENITADGNGDGFVDATDLAIWQDHYGSGVMFSAVVVPEPSVSGLIGVMSCCLLACRTRLLGMQPVNKQK